MSTTQGFIDDLILWPYWTERFEDESGKFITPNNSLVQSAVSESGARSETTPAPKAMACWLWVNDNVQYDLSKRWKTPEQTITEGLGDCEDVTFLLASMFAHAGINKSQVVIGYLDKPQSPPLAHTWNRVNDTLIDGTGSPETVANLTYQEELHYTITTT